MSDSQVEQVAAQIALIRATTKRLIEAANDLRIPDGHFDSDPEGWRAYREQLYGVHLQLDYLEKVWEV